MKNVFVACCCIIDFFSVADDDASESHLKLTTVSDGDVFGGLARLATKRFELFDDVHSFGDSSEYNMAIIQPASLHGGDEELGAICIGSAKYIKIITKIKFSIRI